jgi:undecaprenyl phosphate N,N'-diacetylbacillosamine 1-phosphate transferase
MDIILSFIAILVFSPILIVVAMLVRIKLGSPVFFKQSRPGLNEKIFKMYKFRTMTNERDKFGEFLPDSVRLTKFGRFLRKNSLDELPELLNILKGDMSIVGPRPLAVQYLPYYTPEERKRHHVRPGLTGLAQINGRNALGWEDKFSFDLKYVEMVSFKTDLLIILKTLKKVFEQTDIGERGVDSPLDFDQYRQTESRKKKVMK